MEWAAGMTTAPRGEATLERTVSSLAAAGWSSPRLFVEPETALPVNGRELERTDRDLRLGAYPNFFLGLAELLLRHPQADAYLMVQDDVVFCRGVRAYLERLLWPAGEIGVISLYCPSQWSRGKEPGFHPEDRGWQAWGAHAYVFSNLSIRQFLGHPLALDHRLYGPAEGMRNVDSVVGQWCRLAGLPYYVHVPSLVQHVGNASAIYPAAMLSGNRVAADFVGEDIDVAEFLDDNHLVNRSG